MFHNSQNDNSSGRSAIYCLRTRKLLAVDHIFIYGFVSLISVVTGNGIHCISKVYFPSRSRLLPSYLPHPNSCFALRSCLHRQWSLLHSYRLLMRPTLLPRKISYIYHTILNFILVSFCNAYIIVTFRVRVRVEVWRFGVAVTRWS